MAPGKRIEDIEEIVNNTLKNAPNEMKIRPKQLKAIHHLVKGKDTLCLLPTGGGKSLIYQLLPTVFKTLNNVIKNPIVIIVSPLISLMMDQVEEAHSKPYLNLSAVRLDCSNTVKNEIFEGKHNLVFGSPESWLNNKQWRELLSSKMFVRNVVCLVIDEVHKVNWYLNMYLFFFLKTLFKK